MLPRTIALFVILPTVMAIAAAAALAPPATLGGTVKSVSADHKQITVSIGSGTSAKQETFHLNATTKVTLDDKAAQLADLQPGTKITITYDKTSKQALSIKATSAKSDGSKSPAAGPDSAKPGASKTEKANPSTKTAADPDKDRTALKGVWHGFVVDGKGENPNRGPVHLEVVVSADKITSKDLQSAGKKFSGKSFGAGTFKIGTADKLKTLDASGTDGQEKGKAYTGIYTLDGDTLKWCVANPGKPRPNEFRTKTGQYLMILKRQKS